MYKLLIVDDERLERNAIAETAADAFPGLFEIRDAENGKQAVETAKEFAPDIVFMDIKMPVMNGIDAAKIIISDFPDCKIVMLTGFTYFNYAKECVSIGAIDFLVKPSADEAVVAMLKRAMAEVDKVRGIREASAKNNEKLRQADDYLESELLTEIYFCGADEKKITQTLGNLDAVSNYYTVAAFFPDAVYGGPENFPKLPSICRQTANDLKEEGLRVFFCSYYGRIYMLLCMQELFTHARLLNWLERFLREVTARQKCVAGIGVSTTSSYQAELPKLVR